MATEEKKKKVLISDECILCGNCTMHNPSEKEKYFVMGSEKAEYHGEYRKDVVEPAIDDCPTGAISVEEK